MQVLKPGTYIAPTEPPTLKAQGTVAMLPEDHGCDVLWTSPIMGLCGAQRKVFPNDFLQSMEDGRFTTGMHKMAELDLGVLILEGRPRWTTEGKLLHDRRTNFSKTAYRKFLYTIRQSGVWVENTESLQDTILCIAALQEWCDSPDHKSLSTRPGPKGDGWGRVTNKHYQRWLVQGLPDVGPKLADAIITKVGMPFGLKVTEDDLLTVPGVGKGKAQKIVKVFERTEQVIND